MAVTNNDSRLISVVLLRCCVLTQWKPWCPSLRYGNGN